MSKRWIPKAEPDKNKVETLSQGINVNRTLSAILVQRGIDNFECARKFFRPSYADFHDPFLMKDMKKAVERIDRAISEGEKILIYGDYDVDGTTAVATTYSFFRKRYPNIDFYIPDRYTEGYGISFMSIDWASNNGFSLIIALD
jgi:single-stranded-DNA-specific exonuclease